MKRKQKSGGGRPGRWAPAAGRRFLACVLAAGLAVAACRRAEPPGERPAAAASEAAAGLGELDFRRDFDGGPAGIQLGPGWFEPEPIWGAGREERHGVAWTGQVAEVYFAAPPFGDAEFVGLGLPLVYPGARPQTVTAMLNRHVLGTFPMKDDWSELRIPLPAAALVSPINALVLELARADRPSEVGLGQDTRRLAAVFDTLAVVPRGAPLDGGPPPAALAASPGPAPPPRRAVAGRPDVFVYLIDTLRADSIGVYGSPLPTSPRIDAFSRDALVFDDARSACSWTLPSLVSILSGRYPFHHGVHVPGDRLPPEREPWLPTLMQRAGYETLGISQWLLGGDCYGVERGFDSFFLNIYRNGKMPSANARWFLAEELRRPRQPERPLFAFLHTVDPHALYAPAGEDRRFAEARPGTLPPALYNPQIFLARGLGRNPADVAHLRGLYEGEVHAADREFGAFVDLLKRAGLYDESLIVLVADHGEEFGEHGAFDHGRTLFEELLRVPLLVKPPRSLGIAPRRVAAPVSTLDVPPTVLDAIGRAPGPGFDGVSLLATARRPPARRTLDAETKVDVTVESGAVDLKAVVLGDLKCIGDPTGKDQLGRPVPAVRAYDLRRDPGERAPLPAGGPEAARCAAELARLAARARAEAPAPFRLAIPDEEQARLRALGYIR